MRLRTFGELSSSTGSLTRTLSSSTGSLTRTLSSSTGSLTRTLSRTAERQEAKEGINNQFLITRFIAFLTPVWYS
ncbi:MAG: hypothetical protein EWV92_14370 [Microcystis aeruginosa Ma_MB_S_20031200_S102]|uniref:Uncharacterized protein n=1 Tax=Microcystis aeruginosa Ma_MB_S_20031200_S102 TaxID=2486254 RepID=A0A552EKV3_MICAE|nr:MAG: hypothetical protein EWV79_09625 [Microcystis aeruginosa Ma_MB_S_20031200_S102D]TRU35083.1 MAG: hypothetical protein EWV92_14370 [Microcystis aeruginosa Ma_MB_S_20031200_S102]